MTQNYNQSVDVQISSSERSKQWIGIFSILFSLGFVMVSIFYSWYFMIGFALAFAFGAFNLHVYNKTAKEYLYEFSLDRLTIVKKDVVNRQYRALSLLIKDITDFDIMTDMCEDEDACLYCSKAYDRGVYQITYRYQGSLRKALFAPDEYLIALIKEAIKENTRLDD